MGMSSHVVGYFEANEEYRKKAAAFAACAAAGVDPPDSLRNHDPGEVGPDAPGPMLELHNHRAVKKYQRDRQTGFEIDLEKLPEGVRYLRFYNSW